MPQRKSRQVGVESTLQRTPGATPSSPTFSFETSPGLRSSTPVAPSTVDDHIARVRHQWRNAASVNQHEERQKALERLDYLTRKMEESNRWSAIVQAERLKADLLGLRAEVPVDTARDDGPEMPPEQYVEAILVATQERCEMLLHEGKNDVVALVIERATAELTRFVAWGHAIQRAEKLVDAHEVQ